LTTLWKFQTYNIRKDVLLRYKDIFIRQMVTFFSIFFILLVVNITLFAFSAKDSAAKSNSISGDIASKTDAKIYPMDILDSEYKKAI